MARKDGKDRGLFQRPKDSGIWWVCYFDADGRKHREKVGPKALARKVYEKRKTEVREARFFPHVRKRKVLFDEILNDYRTASEGAEGNDAWGPERYARLSNAFGSQPVESITASAIEDFRDNLVLDHAPATVNRHLQLLRAIFMRAIRGRQGGVQPDAPDKIVPREQ